MDSAGRAGPPPGSSTPSGGPHDSDATVVFPRNTSNDDTVVLPVTRDPDATVVLPLVSATAPIAAPDTESGGGLLRHSAVMAAGSLISRLTGFLRTLMIGAALGGQLVGDAYTTGQALPGMVYELLLGGVLTGVVVPLLVRAKKSDADKGEAFTQRLLTFATIALGAATVGAVVCAPLLTALMAGGSSTEASRDLITMFGYLILPTIFFYGICALLGGVLNARERFAAPTWAPILNNLVVITVCAVVMTLPPHTAPTPENFGMTRTLIMGLGTTLGIVVQAISLWPSLRRSGFRWGWRFDFRNLGLGKLVRLGSWAACYVLVNQIAVVIVLKLANEASAQNASGPLIYNNGFLLLMMANGIIAVSIITALTPRMSAAAADGRFSDVAADLSRGMRLSTVALAPIAVVFLVLAEPIMVTLFQWGEFTHEQAINSALVLSVVALALIPFAISQLLMFGFYALQDTRSTALINIPVVALRIAVYLGLFVLLPIGFLAVGLMVGNAVSYVLAAVLSAWWLRRRIGPLGMRGVALTLAKAFGAAAVAAVAGFAITAGVHVTLGFGRLANATLLVVGGLVIMAVYAAIAILLRTRELTDVLGMVTRKLGVAGRFGLPG